jgi:hypothetical protein
LALRLRAISGKCLPGKESNRSDRSLKNYAGAADENEKYGLMLANNLADVPQLAIAICIEIPMASDPLHWIMPTPSADPEVVEVIELYRITYDFHQEVRYREEREQYVQWYRKTAQRHRSELQQMRQDINLMGWFNRWLHP